MQREDEPQILKITETEDSGVQTLKLSRMMVGMVLNGRLRIYHNDHSTVVEPNCLYLLEPGTHYVEHHTDQSRFEQVVMYLSTELLEQIIIHLSTNYHLSAQSSHQCEKCRYHNFVVCRPTELQIELFHGISRNFRLTEFRNSRVGHQMKISEFIMHVLSGEDNCLRRRLISGSDHHQIDFVRTVYDNVFNDISIEQLATQTHRSLTAFKKDFSSHFHMSPHKWIVTQRLHQARVMLMTSQKTISEIGSACTFSNISHFIKLFKLQYNDTPAALRKRLNKKD